MTTVFRNGHVFDGHRYRSGTSVAVVDGRIAAVGTDEEVVSFAGPGIEEVDLAGGLLLPGFQDGHVHPVQRISLEQALAAYTRGAAFTNHLDDTGTLEVGKRADLAVLDRDPFSGEPGEVGASTVVATYVDGTRVFG